MRELRREADRQAARAYIQPVGMQDLLDQLEVANDVKDALCQDIALRNEQLAAAKLECAQVHMRTRSICIPCQMHIPIPYIRTQTSVISGPGTGRRVAMLLLCIAPLPQSLFAPPLATAPSHLPSTGAGGTRGVFASACQG